MAVKDSQAQVALPSDPARDETDRDLDVLLAPTRWMAPRPAKPELQKALGLVQAHLNEARHLLALPDETTPLRNRETIKQLRALVQIDPTSPLTSAEAS